jgi:hypothetical protein
MLSSVQDHLPGLTAFQKHPWEACLGPDACVWTTARFMKPDPGSYVDGAERFLADIGLLRTHEAVVDLLAPAGLSLFGPDELFEHDGPNYWTGSLALPMIVQHENAAIIAYDVPDEQRNFSGAKTHAWFPRERFDQVERQDHQDGTWFFGRKDTFDALSGDRVGSGYVALYSARQADWTDESGNVWNGKEIQTSGASNIWVAVVGNERQFGSFDAFRQEILASHLNVSGVGTLNGLECSFDVPRAAAPVGRAPRLELFYDERIGRFAGDDLPLDEFPRFENRYIQQLTTAGPRGNGLHPQVERFTSSNAVEFGSRAYTIAHPPTGLSLDHRLDEPARRFSAQVDTQVQSRLAAQRLDKGALTSVRRVRRGAQPHPHPLHHPHRPLRA